jgi:phosphoribosylanthranilate isomerase
VTHVKFCGITSLDDAELCLGHDPWALGLIFVAGSPRRCKQSDAARIVGALRRRVLFAGVFVNATLDHVVHTAEALDLGLVQLHGDEGPSYAAEVARRTGAKVIKAARVRSRADVVALQPFRTDFHLLDGGGGDTFEWSLVRARRSEVPLITAGGLSAGNVGAAIAATQPFAVDVASGVEASPGKKDPEKVAAFAEAVVRADHEVPVA